MSCHLMSCCRDKAISEISTWQAQLDEQAQHSADQGESILKLKAELNAQQATLRQTETVIAAALAER